MWLDVGEVGWVGRSNTAGLSMADLRWCPRPSLADVAREERERKTRRDIRRYKDERMWDVEDVVPRWRMGVAPGDMPNRGVIDERRCSEKEMIAMLRDGNRCEGD
jgi:hypothetical protein